jgi:hypothetical protein
MAKETYLLTHQWKNIIGFKPWYDCADEYQQLQIL